MVFWKPGLKDATWIEYFIDPNKWWDNQFHKRNLKAPNSKHQITKGALWIDGGYTPDCIKMGSIWGANRLLRGSNSKEVHARCPVNREQLSEYLCEVRDLQEDFNVRVPYHGTLEGLEEDALTWIWNSECQEELDNVVQAIGSPFIVQPGEVHDCIVCNCCPTVPTLG